MYCDFYGLQERPFNVTADPRFLYLNSRYREALASLNYGITQRKGFVTLIGEAGTGKTTLLKKLLDDLDETTRTVFIFNTNVTFDEILEYTFSELDLPVHNGKRLYMLQRLNSFLLDELREGRNIALLIDEAQDLDYSVLEDLRLLSNLETATEKILQIVLSGQPELAHKLGNPRLRQLRQRISVNCRLQPLCRDDLTEYIQSRLVAAGGTDPKLFSRDAEDRIFEISAGIPRVVNVLCDNTLVIGYALGKKRLNADVIQEAAADLLPVEGDEAPREEAPPPVLAASEPGSAKSPAPPVSSGGRRFSQSGVVAMVLVAIVIGLLSLGRTMMPHDADSDVMATGQSVSGLEVIQPGARPPSRASDVIEPGGDTGHRWPIGEPPVGRADRPRPPVRAAEPAGRFAAAVPELDTPRREVPVKPRPIAPAEPQRPAPIAAERRQAPVEAAPAVPPRAAQEPAAESLQVAEGNRPDVAPAAVGVSATGSADDGQRNEPRRADLASLGVAPPPLEPEVPVVEPPVALVRPEARPAMPVAVAPPVAAESVAARAGVGSENLRVAVSRYRRVVVRSGDSFSVIAVRYYGQANDTVLDVMKLANPQIADVNLISLGQELRLPQIDEGFWFLQGPGGEYSLLLMSTPMRGRANEMAAALRLRDFDARVTQASLSSRRPIWRVSVGGYAGRESAQDAGRQLRQLFRQDGRIAAMAR